MSNELREFTAEEMRGCPSFVVKDGHRFVMTNDDFCFSIDRDGTFSERTLKCNPMDRMEAICKHLFELMPSSNWIGQYRDATNWITNGYDIELSINPFLHTDITEITREDLGL